MATFPRRGLGKNKIKPPRKHGPQFSMEDTWSKLERNIREIHNHNASNLSFEENHRFAYNMVLHKYGTVLYDGVNRLISENLDKLAKEDIIPAFPTGGVDDPTSRAQECERLLSALRKVWDDHTSSLSKLRDILKYMDRVHTKSAGVPEIWDSGLNIFLQRIIRPPIEGHITSAILSLIQIERDGYVINRSAVMGCVDVLLQLKEHDEGISVYKRDLEPAALRESETFYKAEAQKLLDTCDAPEYLRRVESRFDSEELRTHRYLSRQTAQPMRRILERHLLTANLSAIISMPNSGLDIMIDLDKTDDLARLYRLFIMVPEGLPSLRKALKQSIERRGQEINTGGSGGEALDGEDDEDPEAVKGKGKAKARPPAQQTLSLAIKWVQDVLDLKDKFDLIWEASLKSDRQLESGINEAFEGFINRNDKSAEFISLFIDENLKKGLKGKSDLEVEAVLDKSITVFRFLTEKDVFERYYKIHLSKRLLQSRSVSDDAERGMLAKLKVECGYQFTQKLEGMFHDMRISADHMRKYKEKMENTTSPPIDINVTVMTSTFWPMSHSAMPCRLPEIMLRSTRSFEQFYLSQHSGRRLMWQPSLGNADVRVQFKARKHDLNVSTIALVILLLFEDVGEGDFLTYEDIQSGTDIPEAELRRNLQSLACAKYKILKKHPAGRDVNEGDAFSFNGEFGAPLQKIKISTVAARVETGEERRETRDRVDEERKHQMEACIVRIMKDRKHMTHNDLVNEVTKQLTSRFAPQPMDIKKRIENLIDREYLERCEDRKSYNYVA